MSMISIEGISFTYNAYNIMKGLFTAKWSANRVQTYMSGIGMGYRRSSVQLVRRHVLDLVKKEHMIRALPDTKRPTKTYLVEMAWERSYRYKIFGEWNLFNLDTGEYTTEDWSIYADQIPTKQEVKQKLADQFVIGDYDFEGVIQEIAVRQYLHKQGAGY